MFYINLQKIRDKTSDSAVICGRLQTVESDCREYKALSIMRYQDDINTEHNMKSICRAAVAQWPKSLTRNG